MPRHPLPGVHRSVIPVDEDCREPVLLRHVTIRDLHTEDLPRLAPFVRSLLPSMVITERGLDHMRKSTRWWVVEEDGELVAAARAGRFGRAWVGVAPQARGNGVGSELVALVEDEVRRNGHPRAIGWTDDEPSTGFARRRGYAPTRTKPVSVVRLDEVEVPPLEIPAGVEAVPLLDLGERLHDLYALTMAAYRDDTDEALDAQQTFEEWLRDDMGVPDLDFDGSVVLVVDGRLAALALVTTDGDTRAENEFTGTHPEFRGRGLATLAKLVTLHWAREQGIREVWTGNDAENAAMLWINRKLGYVRAWERTKLERAV